MYDTILSFQPTFPSQFLVWSESLWWTSWGILLAKTVAHELAIITN